MNRHVSVNNWEVIDSMPFSSYSLDTSEQRADLFALFMHDLKGSQEGVFSNSVNALMNQICEVFNFSRECISETNDTRVIYQVDENGNKKELVFGDIPEDGVVSILSQ